TCDKYAHLNEKQCIETCVENGVTNGKGRGFGLFALSNFVRENRGKLLLHSGRSSLEISAAATTYRPSPLWQGTYVFWEINTNMRVEPGSFTNGYVSYAHDYDERYNGTDFAEGELW